MTKAPAFKSKVVTFDICYQNWLSKEPRVQIGQSLKLRPIMITDHLVSITDPKTLKEWKLEDFPSNLPEEDYLEIDTKEWYLTAICSILRNKGMKCKAKIHYEDKYELRDLLDDLFFNMDFPLQAELNFTDIYMDGVEIKIDEIFEEKLQEKLDELWTFYNKLKFSVEGDVVYP